MVIFVCLPITLPHNHHNADLSEGIKLIKCLSGTFCLEWLSKIKPIISIIFHAIYGTVCIQLTHFLTRIIIIKSDPLAIVSGYVMKQLYALYVFWYPYLNNLCVYFTSNASIHSVYRTTKVLYLPYMLVYRDWKQSPLIKYLTLKI